MQTYTHILFDLDGTLSDPKTGITRSVQYALKKLGIEVTDPDVLVPFIGPPLADSFANLYNLDPDETKKAIEYYREYFTVTGMFENVLYPNIRELLRDLNDAGKTLVIATSKPTVFAKQIADYFNITQYFDWIIGSNLDGTRVHKTEVIRHVLSLLPTIEKRQCIMIGDRKFDIHGAQTLGLDSIAVTYGYGPLAELHAAEPTYLADSVDAVREIIFS